MRAADRDNTIKRYSDRLRQFGYDPRTLGWNKGRQEVRFKALTGIGNMDGCSVLDVGCGFGDLYGYLKATGRNVDYTGIDINADLIEIGRNIYPEAKFEVMDFDETMVSRQFDWVFESGIFNFRLDDNWSYITRVLKKMFASCRKGVAADFMSSYVDFNEKTLYYARPEEVYGLCKSLSRRVSIRGDYMPFEFAVYIYKDESFNKRVVFTEFDEELSRETLQLPFLQNR
jgi:Methylase involved in ubiquinone/menaquinone biosynthesis